MPVPAGPRFTPLCGAALPQEGADLYHPGLTVSELMSGEESKNTSLAAWRCPLGTYPQPLCLGEALAAGLAPPGSRSSPKPAMSHPCPCRTTNQQKPPRLWCSPPDCAGAAFCLSLLPPGHSDSGGGISASPSVYPGTGLTCHSCLLFSPALSSPKIVAVGRTEEKWGAAPRNRLALLSVPQCQEKGGRSPVPQGMPWVTQHSCSSPGTAGDRAPRAHRGFLG